MNCLHQEKSRLAKGRGAPPAGTATISTSLVEGHYVAWLSPVVQLMMSQTFSLDLRETGCTHEGQTSSCQPCDCMASLSGCGL